jgi:hypothetical protein
MGRTGSGHPYCESCHDVGWIRYRTRPASAIPRRHRFSSRKRLIVNRSARRCLGCVRRMAVWPGHVALMLSRDNTCAALHGRPGPLTWSREFRQRITVGPIPRRVKVALSPTHWPSQCYGGLIGGLLARRHCCYDRETHTIRSLNTVHLHRFGRNTGTTGRRQSLSAMVQYRLSNNDRFAVTN